MPNASCVICIYLRSSSVIVSRVSGCELLKTMQYFVCAEFILAEVLFAIPFRVSKFVLHLYPPSQPNASSLAAPPQML